MSSRKKGKASNKSSFKKSQVETLEQTTSFDEPQVSDSNGGNVEEKNNIQSATSSDPPKLSQRDIIKLKKKKQKGLLTEAEASTYASVLDVTRSVSSKNNSDSADLQALIDASGGDFSKPISGLSDFNQRLSDKNDKNIYFDSVNISYQSKPLLREACVKLPYGRKFGLIGYNGSGKSTLLRHLSCRYLPVQEGIKILHVEQEAEASNLSALEYVVNSDKYRLSLLEEEAKLKLSISQDASKDETGESQSLERLIQVYDELRAANAYNAESRASVILSGLQFTDKMKGMATKDFSGGWRMRIALASALFINPDLLILDEPTNHLDLNAVIWLEMYLKRWVGTLLVVSHDRDFLNYFVTDIIHLDSMKLEYYHGNYDSFESVINENSAKNKKIAKKAQQAANKTAQKGSAKPTATVKPKSYNVQFEFDSPDEILYPVIQVQDMSFSYGGKESSKEDFMFLNVEKNIDMESKIAIVGPNGAGKTTFLNLVLGELEPTSGKVVRNRKLKIVKFAQHFVEQLETSQNAISYLQKNHPDLDVQVMRTYMGKFGLSGKTHTNPIALLSGGQKSRVMLTNIAIKNPHLMFLDEPTNHLDIQSVDALTEALQQFKGGLVMISHDQRLLSKVCTEIWVIRGNQQVEVFEGDFWEYRQSLIDEMNETLFDQWQELEQDSYKQKITK